MEYSIPIAIIPDYDSNSNNCTRLIFEDGKETFVNMTVEKFINKMLTRSLLSYRATAKWASFYLLEKTTPPLLFDENHVFLHCQTRTGVTKGHGCYGYISLFAVDKIESTTVSLRNGIQIPTCSTLKSLTKHSKHAALLHCFYFGTRNYSRIIPLHTEHMLQNLSEHLRSSISR